MFLKTRPSGVRKANFLCKEEMLDPWLIDDPVKQKIFSISGFADQPDTVEDLVQKIRWLGGLYVTSDEWDPRVTHVITEVDNKRQGKPEKVMAAIAGGRWVLTKRYVEKSYKANGWPEYPALFTHPGEAVISSRRRWFLTHHIQPLTYLFICSSDTVEQDCRVISPVLGSRSRKRKDLGERRGIEKEIVEVVTLSSDESDCENDKDAVQILGYNSRGIIED